ncbi:MAG: exodeoxyribonuclease VII small subunit [Verrucomicrobiaceae bacterium]
MASKKKIEEAPVAASFEDAIEELDELTERLAHEPESLGAMIDDYERGQQLIHYCHEALKLARKRITTIQASLQDNSPDDDEPESKDSPSDENDDVRLF